MYSGQIVTYKITDKNHKTAMSGERTHLVQQATRLFSSSRQIVTVTS